MIELKTTIFTQLSTNLDVPLNVDFINSTQWVKGNAFEMFSIMEGKAPIGIVAPDKNNIGINNTKPIAVACLRVLQIQEMKKPKENIAVIERNVARKKEKKFPCSLTPYTKKA